MSASARLPDPTMSAADQYPLTVIPVIVGLAAFILKKQDTSAEVVRTAMVAAGAFWGAHLLPESPGSSLQGVGVVRGSRSGCVSGCGPGARRKLRLAWLPAENGAQAKALPVAQGRLRAAGGRANWAWTPACWREARRLQTSTLGPGMQEPGPSSIGGKTFCPPSAAFQGPRPGQARGCPGGRRATGLAWPVCVGHSTWDAGRGARIRDFSPARPLRLWFPLEVRGHAFGRGPPPRPRAGHVPKAARRPCRLPLAGRARAGPLGPGAAAPARLAARSFWRPRKMTICHSIKVSGQLMGEPGSATPGQNGLLPRIGEVQMLNAEHCALSQPRPPPGRRSARWTAAG